MKLEKLDNKSLTCRFNRHVNRLMSKRCKNVDIFILPKQGLSVSRRGQKSLENLSQIGLRPNESLPLQL
jgi:hypothetical protein